MRVVLILLLGLSALWAGTNHDYLDGKDSFEGYYAPAAKGESKGVAVLVAHAWKGLGDHEKMVVDRLVALGYPTLAADVYGKGVRLKTNQEASAEAGKYYGNRTLLRQRIERARQELSTLSGIVEARVVAIGYCFGGTTVLELAREGSGVAAVVSFHGGLKPDLE